MFSHYRTNCEDYFSCMFTDTMYLFMLYFQITFVGSGTSFTISNLEKGRVYFFNIFAEHNNTWLNFLYASKSLVYDSKLRRIGLKDNKPMMVNIRRLGGRALFRYKVSYDLLITITKH